MIRFLILFLIVNLYSGEGLPGVKKIDEYVNKQHQQQLLTHPDELLGKIKKSKEKVKPKSRSGSGNHIYPQPENKYTKNSRTHRDFTIYNFERIDEDLATLRDEAIYTAEEIGEIRSREKVYIEALEDLLVKSKRYDHFFVKWDDLKESFKGLWAVGGGSFFTAFLGALGFWFQRKRKKKKENGGKS